MRKLNSLLVAVILAASVFAQAPEKMSYQAVIRNSSNALVTNTQIGMRISILQGSASGTAVYVETQTPTTNANGLVSIEIGAGTVVSGNFATIDWANGLYFIKTEIDPAGGTSYTITGTSQLLSVPYALHAKTAEKVINPLWVNNLNGIHTNEIVGIGTSAPDANMHIIDHTGISPLKMESDDNIYTLWQSNRTGVDDYIVGIDGGNNRFMFSNLANSQMLLTLKGTNVGISQPSPQASLDILGSFKLVNGSQGSGKLLTSDDQGNAVWSTPANATNTTNGFMSSADKTKLDGIADGTAPGQMQYWNGTAWVTIAAGLNNQTLKCKNGVPTWTDGNLNDLSIGDGYQGGVIAYFLQSGDPGYDANVRHGIIAAPSDQSNGSEWGCKGTLITGADGTEIGTGSQNTSDIVSGCTTEGIAAKLCYDLVLGGYSDWYLPSLDELNKLYLNKTAIGGFTDDYYWSSSERDENGAWLMYFLNGGGGSTVKTAYFKVRAVRAF